MRYPTTPTANWRPGTGKRGLPRRSDGPSLTIGRRCCAGLSSVDFELEQGPDPGRRRPVHGNPPPRRRPATSGTRRAGRSGHPQPPALKHCRLTGCWQVARSPRTFGAGPTRRKAALPLRGGMPASHSSRCGATTMTGIGRPVRCRWFTSETRSALLSMQGPRRTRDLLRNARFPPAQRGVSAGAIHLRSQARSSSSLRAGSLGCSSSEVSNRMISSARPSRSSSSRPASLQSTG